MRWLLNNKFFNPNIPWDPVGGVTDIGHVWSCKISRSSLFNDEMQLNSFLCRMPILIRSYLSGLILYLGTTMLCLYCSNYINSMGVLFFGDCGSWHADVCPGRKYPDHPAWGSNSRPSLEVTKQFRIMWNENVWHWCDSYLILMKEKKSDFIPLLKWIGRQIK